MIDALRPGYDYDPPNGKRLDWQLLDEVNKLVDFLMKEEKTAIITLMLDGWSNTIADQIISSSNHTDEML